MAAELDERLDAPFAFVRRPGPRLAEGIVTHIDRTPVDVDRARQQWRGYVDALVEHGWAIVEVEPADDCPDAVFIEDAVVVFDDLAVITRPGAAERRGETRGAEAAARRQGLEVAFIEQPACLDGGDVLKVDLPGRRRAYVGVGGRTDLAGVQQLATLVAPLGWDVVPVPLRGVLHLKSAVTALPDGTIIGHPDLLAPDVLADAEVFDRFLPVPEESGGHVVLLGGDRLLVAASAPETIAMFRAEGYTPVVVDISEFERLEGCVTCLSVRVRPTTR